MRVYKNDGTKNTRVTVTADDSGAKIHYRDADNAGALRFNNNLGEVMRITANTTRLGIGTTNPDGTLHISGTGTAPAKLIWERSDGGVGSKNWTAYIDNTHDLLFGKTNDSGTLTHDYLHIEDGGNIGIGNSSPPAKLSVFGTGAGNATVQIEGEGGADPYINFLANNAQHWSLGVDDSDADKFKLSEHSALGTNDYLVVDVTGQVGIGTSSPAASLSIAGSSTGEYDALILRNGNSAASGQSTAIIFEASAGTLGDEASSVAKISGLRTGGGSKGDLLFHTTLAGVSSEKMRIDSSGLVGIGVTSPSSYYANELVVNAGGEGGLTLVGATTHENYLMFADGTTGTDRYSGYVSYNHGSNFMRFATNGGTERMRIDSSGNLLVGKTSLNDSLAGFQTSPSGDTRITRSGGAALVLNRKTSDGTILDIRKDGSTVGSIGVTNFDLTIQSSASGHNGLRFGNAWIAPIATNQALDDGTTDLGLQGARFKDLYLSGSAKLTSGNRSTDGKGGALIVGGNSDSNGLTTNTRKIGLITCPSYDNTDGNMALITGDTSSASTNYIYIGSAYTGYSSPTDIVFRTGSVGTIGSERTRIDSSGNQLWGKTSADNTTQGIRFLGSSGFMSVVRSNNTLAIFNRIDGDGTLLEFRTSGTTQGSISISGSTTSYNTTSDERLKQNIEDADDAGAIVDAIQVRKFDWIEGGEHQRYGMVAQELNTVAPEAVSVPDDAEEMQSVDYSKLVPMLVKEIQSLRARVAQLEGEN